MLNNIVKNLEKNKLLKSGISYTLGNFFIQGISFITIPLFAQLLTLEEYGVVSLYGTWLSIFSIVISLDLVSSVGRGKYDFKGEYDDFLSSTMWLSFLCFGIFLVIGVLFRGNLSNLTELAPCLIVMLIIQSFFEFVISFVSSKYTINYEYKRYLVLSITSTIAKVVLAVIIILNLNKDKYMGRIQGGLTVSVLYGIVLFFAIMKKGKIKINKKYWKYALLISIPLIPHSLSGVILSQFDRIMISKEIGKGANGIYSFAYSIGLILNVVWVALNKAWIPYFFENMDNKNYDDIKKKYKYYIAIFSIITFVLIFVSPEIVKIFAYRAKAYRQGISIVPIVMASNFFIFLYSLPSNLEFYMKKTYLISLGTFGAGFLNILLNYIFISKYGYIGAAWATLISYIALFIYHYVIATMITENKIFEVKYFIISSGFVVLVGIMFYLLKDRMIVRYVLVAIVFLFLIYKFKKVAKSNI